MRELNPTIIRPRPTEIDVIRTATLLGVEASHSTAGTVILDGFDDAQEGNAESDFVAGFVRIRMLSSKTSELSRLRLHGNRRTKIALGVAKWGGIPSYLPLRGRSSCPCS